MKRLIFISALLFFSLSVFAQKDWMIGIHASPNYSFRTNPIKILGNQGNLSYQFGINSGIMVDENIMLNFGVKYIQYSETNFLDDLNLTFESDILGSGTDPIIEELAKIDIRNNYNYLTLPLGLRVYFGGKRVTWFIESSLESQFLLSTWSVQTRFGNNGESAKIRDNHNFNVLRKVNLAGSISFGAEIPLSEKFFLTIQPNYQIQLLPAARISNFRGMRLYAFGCQVGGYYLVSK